ncbi:MAG: M23 family metallopeptidase [Lachnospiraceae bacterium]|nr:M23 family metallopeptidase [Lachnospiraceae bacterium]
MEANTDKGTQKNKKKEKKNIRCHILFMPDDDAAEAKKLSVKAEILAAFFVAVVFLIIAALTYCVILSAELRSARQSNVELTAQISELTEENDLLLVENEELEEKVAILSDTVNDKVQQEEERAAEEAQSCIPSGFPLKGTAAYDENETELDGEPIAYFQVAQGTGVIATANGTVSSIAGTGSSGYIIMVDHGNGYFSVYRNGSKPKVSEGDEVTKATELFVIEEGQERLGYQIIQDNQYIDPLELMEIYG